MPSQSVTPVADVSSPTAISRQIHRDNQPAAISTHQICTAPFAIPPNGKNELLRSADGPARQCSSSYRRDLPRSPRPVHCGQRSHTVIASGSHRHPRGGRNTNELRSTRGPAALADSRAHASFLPPHVLRLYEHDSIQRPHYARQDMQDMISSIAEAYIFIEREITRLRPELTINFTAWWVDELGRSVKEFYMMAIAEFNEVTAASNEQGYEASPSMAVPLTPIPEVSES